MSAVREVKSEPERIRRTTWKEYAVRFLFGGVITAIVGVVGKAFGPVVAGLFLAFPAILPASVTLIERHEMRRAAGADALGAAIGSIGLLVFGAIVWTFAARGAAWLVLAGATLAWFVVSAGLWTVFEWTRRGNHPG